MLNCILHCAGCFCIGYIPELGIYSELNTPQCITYAVPPSPAESNTESTDTQDSLQCLENALLALSRQYNIDTSETPCVDTSANKANRANITPISNTDELGYIRSTQNMFHTDSVPTSMEGGGVNEALVGRISAETVRHLPCVYNKG